MKRVLALAVLALLFAATAPAGEQTVTWKSGDEQASGLLVTPEGKGPFPATIVIQEWWGLNDWVKDQARALAKEGYVALAVDLYRGKVATTQEDAHQLMMGTPPDRALRDLQGAFAYLQAQARREEGPHRRDRVVHGRPLLAAARHGRADARGRPSPTTARRRRSPRRSPRSRRR